MAVENLLYSNYIRYDRLYYLVQHALSKYLVPNSTIDIYIDMNSMLRYLYRYDSIILDPDSIVTSSIINLCAHIREYFWSRHRVMTRIFIVYGDNFPNESRRVLPSYNQSKYAEYATKFQSTDLINHNISIMDSIVPYLHGIYFIHDTEVETSVLINTLMRTYSVDPNAAKIVYTRDPYAYQLVAMNGRTFLFRPKKGIDSTDISWVVTKKNMYEAYCGESGLAVAPNTPRINHQFISLIMAMSGLKCRNIKGVMRFSTAMKTINTTVSEMLLPSGYSTAFEFALNDVMKVTDRDKIPTIKNNFLALDLNYNSGLYVAQKPAYLLDKFIIDLNDPDTVKDINNKYFVKNPLDLLAL